MHGRRTRKADGENIRRWYQWGRVMMGVKDDSECQKDLEKGCWGGFKDKMNHHFGTEVVKDENTINNSRGQ